MVAPSMRLLNPTETDRIFDNDPEYAKIKQQSGVAPFCIQIKYQATVSASKTELGSAAAAIFDGSTYEKTTVVASTRVLTPGGSYFHFYVIDSSSVITQYYCWFSKYQVTTIQCLTAALTTTGTYFTITDSEGAPTSYYVWMDKNGDGTTDKPTVATLTEIACDISGATTADDVATIVAAAVNGVAGFGASATTDTVTVTHATKGDPSVDAADVDTTYTITKVESGGADPAPGGTGAECDIKAATTAANVGTVVQGIIDALSDVTASGTATVTILNDELGDVSPSVDGTTGFTITTIENGAASHQGAPLYVKSAQANDTDGAAGDMRKTLFIGFAKTSSGVPILKSEEVSLAGATVVQSAELLWIRLLHHKGIDWGTAGKDALGIITLESLAGTDYQLIAAGENESEGCVIWIPNHWHAKIAEMTLIMDDIALATAGDGALVVAEQSGLDETLNNRANTNPDNVNVAVIAINRENPKNTIRWPTKAELHGTDVGKITFKESKINNVVDIDFTAYVILWYKANA